MNFVIFSYFLLKSRCPLKCLYGTSEYHNDFLLERLTKDEVSHTIMFDNIYY